MSVEDKQESKIYSMLNYGKSYGKKWNREESMEYGERKVIVLNRVVKEGLTVNMIFERQKKQTMWISVRKLFQEEGINIEIL